MARRDPPHALMLGRRTSSRAVQCDGDGLDPDQVELTVADPVAVGRPGQTKPNFVAPTVRCWNSSVVLEHYADSPRLPSGFTALSFPLHRPGPRCDACPHPGILESVLMSAGHRGGSTPHPWARAGPGLAPRPPRSTLPSYRLGSFRTPKRLLETIDTRNVHGTRTCLLTPLEWTGVGGVLACEHASILRPPRMLAILIPVFSYDPLACAGSSTTLRPLPDQTRITSSPPRNTSEGGGPALHSLPERPVPSRPRHHLFPGPRVCSGTSGHSLSMGSERLRV